MVYVEDSILCVISQYIAQYKTDKKEEKVAFSTLLFSFWEKKGGKERLRFRSRTEG